MFKGRKFLRACSCKFRRTKTRGVLEAFLLLMLKVRTCLYPSITGGGVHI